MRVTSKIHLQSPAQGLHMWCAPTGETNVGIASTQPFNHTAMIKWPAGLQNSGTTQLLLLNSTTSLPSLQGTCPDLQPVRPKMSARLSKSPALQPLVLRFTNKME